MAVRLSHTAKAAPRARPRAPPPSDNARIAATLAGPEVRHGIIAQAAYFRARRRGFAPGHELEDWLAAEAEVEATLAIGLPSAAD